MKTIEVLALASPNRPATTPPPREKIVTGKARCFAARRLQISPASRQTL